MVWLDLISNLQNIYSTLPQKCDEKLPDILLYGNRRFDTKNDQNILMCSLKFITQIHKDLAALFSKLPANQLFVDDLYIAIY